MAFSRVREETVYLFVSAFRNCFIFLFQYFFRNDIGRGRLNRHEYYTKQKNHSSYFQTFEYTTYVFYSHSRDPKDDKFGVLPTFFRT